VRPELNLGGYTSSFVPDISGNIYFSASGVLYKMDISNNTQDLTGGFSGAFDMVIDSLSNIYYSYSNSIFKYNNTSGIVTFAGGTTGYLDGQGTNAYFDNVKGITIDSSDNLYVVDYLRIRKIDPSANVTTIAGNGSIGYINGTGDIAQFNNPLGITIDLSSNLYVTDTDNNVIRKIDISGNVSTLAGNGTNGLKDGSSNTSQFNYPKSITIDSSNNLFVSDTYNIIRKITNTNKRNN
jgi:hypothetical protein